MRMGKTKDVYVYFVSKLDEFHVTNVVLGRKTTVRPFQDLYNAPLTTTKYCLNEHIHITLVVFQARPKQIT